MSARSGTVAIVAVICLLAGVPDCTANGPIVIGVVIDGTNQEARAPLAAYLSRAMGRPVMVQAPGSYGETVAALADGSYDFACLGALVYIRARSKYGVIPLVQRKSDLHYYSVFITGTNSSIHGLNDLKGRRFAFGDIDSTSGRLLPEFELRQAGIDPETDLKYRFTGSHPATAALVANGEVDAGAIDKTVFDFLISSQQLDSKRVRVFYTSAPFVDYVWVARKGVSYADQEKFARAFLALREGKDDRVLKILRAQEYVVANDAEYATTRKIESDMGRKVRDPSVDDEKSQIRSPSPF